MIFNNDLAAYNINYTDLLLQLSNEQFEKTNTKVNFS